jgi:hypothetical protein
MWEVIVIWAVEGYSVVDIEWVAAAHLIERVSYVPVRALMDFVAGLVREAWEQI